MGATFCYKQPVPSPGDFVDSSVSPYATLYPSTMKQFREQEVFSSCLRSKTQQQQTSRGLGAYDLQKLTSFVQIMTSTGNKDVISDFNHRMWYTRFISLTDPENNFRSRVQGCVEDIYFNPTFPYNTTSSIEDKKN